MIRFLFFLFGRREVRSVFVFVIVVCGWRSLKVVRIKYESK